MDKFKHFELPVAGSAVKPTAEVGSSRTIELERLKMTVGIIGVLRTIPAEMFECFYLRQKPVEYFEAYLARIKSKPPKQQDRIQSEPEPVHRSFEIEDPGGRGSGQRGPA